MRSHSTHLSAGGRGGVGVARVFAACVLDDCVVAVFLLLFGVRGQRVQEKDPGDESVQNRGEQKRQHEKDAKIEKVNW